MLLAFTGSESHSFRGSTGLAILIPAYATYLIVVVFRVWNILTMYGTSQKWASSKIEDHRTTPFGGNSGFAQVQNNQIVRTVQKYKQQAYGQFRKDAC